LKLCDEEEFIDEILATANTLSDEEEYYVNMANAWLIAECFVNFRDKTLAMLYEHKLNKFTINKTISKCRDSFRISKEDKELLYSFKQK
jgi:3-methyladenine DNA glycosylase AlkD